jgi:hypothetical protein
MKNEDKPETPDQVIMYVFVDDIIRLRDCDFESTYKKVQNAIFVSIKEKGKYPTKRQILEMAANL